MGVESNIWKGYATFPLSMFHFVGPIIMLYLGEIGLSLQESVFIFASIFFITAAIFEYPSGILADLWGRKKTLVLSEVLFVINIIILTFGKSVLLLAFGGFIAGISRSMASGTADSLIYDSLIKLKREGEYKKIFGRYMSLSWTALAITGIIGSIIYTYNIKFPFYGALFLAVLNLFITLSLTEPKYHKETSIKKQIKSNFKLFFRKKELIGLNAFSLAMIGSFDLFHRSFVQVHLVEIGISVALLGSFILLLRFTNSFGSEISHKIKLDNRTSLLITIILAFTSFIGLYFFQNIYGFIFLLLFYLIRGISNPIYNEEKHKIISSKERASIISLINFNTMITIGIFAILFGYMAHTKSIFFSMIGFASLVLISFIFFILFYRKNNNIFKAT